MTETLRHPKPHSLCLRMVLLAVLVTGSTISSVAGVDTEWDAKHESVSADASLATAGELRPAVAQIGLGMAFLFDFNGYGQAGMLLGGHVLGMVAGAKIAVATASVAVAIAAPIALPVAGAL